jgi:hypothetical protein
MIVVAAPVSVSAAATATVCDRNFLLVFRPWYKGLTKSHFDCDLKQPTTKDDGTAAVSGGISLNAFIWTIILNVSNDLFALIGFCAVGYLMYGGYMYMLSRGKPDGMTNAKKIITNAIIGLVISIIAVGIVNLIVGIIGA